MRSGGKNETRSDVTKIELQKMMVDVGRKSEGKRKRSPFELGRLSLSLSVKGFFEGKGERILLKAKNSIPYTKKRKSRDCFKGTFSHPNILRIYLLEIFGFFFFPGMG